MLGLVGQVEESLRQGRAAARVAADDQDGVVPGDRAEDVTEVGLVEGAGEELRGARRRAASSRCRRR